MDHSAFMPHGICYLWKPELVWLHAVSDAVIALAYYAIPPALIYLVYRARREARALGMPGPARGLPYEWVYLAFGLFIVACGTTHVMGVINVWHPSYWLSGGVKVVTALASVATAIALPPLMPRAIALFREARISELQHAQLAQLAAIVEHSDDAIFTETLDGVVSSWNAGAARLYGYPAERMVGARLVDTIAPGRHQEIGVLLSRVAKGESVTHYETRRTTADGREIDISLTMSPVRNALGDVVAASAIARDITDRRRAEQRNLELARAQLAREEAEKLAADLSELSDAKSEFLAVMSHELRTPLNAVVGYVDVLDTGVHGPLTERQRDDLKRINRSVEHLRGLIDQILRFTRLEAGLDDAEAIDFDLAHVVEEAVQIVEPAAEARALPVEREAEPGITLRGDPVYVRQILVNLLSNAIKFTQQGSVRVTAAREGGRIRIVVADTGIGISAEYLPRVFDPFWQVDRGRARRTEGIGLGLTVAQRLAREMGGDIEVESVHGQGSTFTVTLPAG